MHPVLTTHANLHANTAARASQMISETAQLAAQPPNPATLTEGFALAAAAYSRTAALQNAWMNDWTKWAAYAQSLQGVDTVPKYVDRIGNITLQAQAQVMTQCKDWAELMDNFGVNYAYLVHQRLSQTGD